jgi:hypothetical protein
MAQLITYYIIITISLYSVNYLYHSAFKVVHSALSIKKAGGFQVHGLDL